ncbi:hypothetical protein KIF59_06145 [Enterobacter cloacae subsp. cloacae]|nr:hypothetical protein [Enterobacter cloacae subsp. cloacae]
MSEKAIFITSERGYQIMLGVGIVVLILAVGLLLAVRYWLRRLHGASYGDHG